MDININIKLDLDEVAELLVNADELQKWVLGHINDMRSWVQDIQEYGMKLNNPVEPDEMPPIERELVKEETPAAEEAATVSLEEVRAKLAALSQAGKQEQVKGLITKFGAKKLTDVPKEKYPELLEAAGNL